MADSSYRPGCREPLTRHPRHLKCVSYRDRVAADKRKAEWLGATGTPFTVLDGSHALSGAVSVDTLLAAMITVWEATYPAPAPPRLLAEGESEGVCGPQGCAVPTVCRSETRRGCQAACLYSLIRPPRTRVWSSRRGVLESVNGAVRLSVRGGRCPRA